MKYKETIISLMMFLAATAVQAQITISGNVYGGGNAGNLGGSTNVKIYAGDFKGSVYGGARQADIAGCTYVNIDGEKMSGNIIINKVYGGNDVSGIIGSLEAIESTKDKPDDERLDAGGHHSSGSEEHHDDDGTLKNVSTFILTTPERKVTTGTGTDAVTTQPYHIFIAQLFGSGNGDYTYTVNADDALKWDVEVGDEIIRRIDKPEAARTYVDLHGGTFGYAYAGGNNASVTTAANICVNNTSTPWKLSGPDGVAGNEDDVISDAELQRMGINTHYFDQSGTYNFSRVFGGNNKAEMKIRPSWHLANGSIENLYSGGDEGAMTSPEGILLVVKPDEGGKLKVHNIFAGCRKAPVTPKSISSGEAVIPETVEGYKFPRGLAARVLVYGGDITNVYGGNDITGRVTGGSAIGIYSSIKGCVYGGGNGSYAYTDNPALKDSPLYGDFYYDVDELLKQKYSNWADDGFANLDATQKSFKSAEALNLFRPNAEQVSLRVWGTEQKPTIIGGAVYIGGNSATLKPVKADYMIEFKIGSHVISDSVFLANNGASMVTEDILSRYKSTVKDVEGNDQKYSQMNFLSEELDGTDLDETGNGKTTFAKYMDGVVLEAGPQVVFDNVDNGDPYTYSNYTTQFGSFYCGGNVGSMRNNATTTINVNYKVVIFEKLVGGSNKAYVPASDYNVQYRGGLLGTPPLEGENKGVKVKLNLSGVKIQPKRWKLAKNGEGKYYKDDKGNYVKEIDPETNLPKELEWNTYIGATPVEPPTEVPEAQEGQDYNTTEDDLNRRLIGGNIYGGCYESGHVNGSVVININGSMVDRDGEFGVFDTVVGDTLGEAILYGHKGYEITERRSGVILDEQGMDVLGTALNVFGGGYGKDSEIWGNTTINLNKGYMFQLFGGSEQGVIGKSMEDSNNAVEADDPETTEVNEQNFDYEFNGKHFQYNAAYSTTINVHGEHVGASKLADISEDLAEAEFIYGGGFEGPIMGDTRINLGNGRVFNTFAGSCNADILGHTETYIGQWTVGSGETATTITGFPWVRDYTYGGNDLGGTIMRSKSFKSQLNDGTLAKIYGYRAPTAAVGEEGDEGYVPADPGNEDPAVLTASAYTEYKQGRVGGIFGGCYGDYDYVVKYKDVADADELPYMDNAFVNISPLEDNVGNKGNYLGQVFGAGQGYEGYRGGDKVQNRSYVLIDIPTTTEKFKDAEVFGAGSRNGLGMRTRVDFNAAESDKDAASAIIDLISGQISAVYGGSYNEGVTRRTLINVPAESKIHIENIFGGAYGTLILPPCDVYESNVNYNNTNEKARVTGAIFGGNNNERRALYTKINISSPVWSDKDNGYLATVYGAGKGVDTWSEYTEVNLERGAKVYEAYGGGQMGHVLNAQSVQAYMQTYYTLQKPSPDIAKKNPKWSQPERWTGKVGESELKTEALKTEWLADWKKAWTLGDFDNGDGTNGYYTPAVDFSNYIDNTRTNFTNVAERPELDDETAELFGNAKKFNTHVIINEGAMVEGYVYGGGLGTDTIALSGDTYGTTYVALLGGTVKKDIYAAGTSGAVYDLFKAKNFTASTNAYIEGGTMRNVYGGGWKGNVGVHTGAEVNGKYYDVAGSFTADIPGETNVVIGIHRDKESGIDGYGFLKGDPAIQRNAYGGGEGGAVFGTANLTLRNGHIGYVHLNEGECQDEKGNIVAGTRPKEYDEKINDETYYSKKTNEWLGNKSLEDAGCLFGGGYIDNSTVDITNVTVYGGQVRNSLFGGGEIAAIGRGLVTVSTTNPSGRDLTGIYKAGKTNVYLYEGNIGRNVFGGGRGYNNLNEHGSLDSDGFIFGQTEVHIYGGEIGTMSGVAKGDGNVFGGGDVGYVYSAYEYDDNGTKKLGLGKSSGARYDNNKEGYYYKYENNAYVTGYPLTEDCKVVIEPHAKVVNAAVTINGNEYAVGKYVPTSDLNTLSAKSGTDAATWANLDPFGIIIHNAVFAGGNTSTGSSSANANTPSVFGNATASIHDVYHRDLITLGSGHTGGLYGDGNLTLVDGYRELNITNYGTDYYTIAREITIDEYHALPEREAAYYELRYTCLKECRDKDGTIYRPKDPDNENSKASTITADDLLTLFLEETPANSGTYVSVKDGSVDILIYDEDKGWIPNPNDNHPYWKESGVLPVYAGRLMNSIQRADFCGVFGSRMVMQGARDRVPEITDFTNYTINRVREVSLNQQHSKIESDLTLKTGKTKVTTNFPEDQDPDDFADLDKAIHGNYFGIYNIVNFLGGLTSDVHFIPGTIAEGGKDKRRTDNTNTDMYGPEIQEDEEGNPIYVDGKPQYVGDDLTYYQWKAKHIKDRTRNNGTSFNKVALASGVYLELTTEKSTGKELNEKDWGYITGVVELDLINVQTGIGGGFVYAKNEHRVGSPSSQSQVTLTALNDGAVSRKNFTYEGGAEQEWETSGNFVHSTQTIIDDCYNISGKYSGTDAVPAHYWYIKGSVYVYDQYISAYTGASNAYSETVDIPLTIAAASHGTMKLVDVKPNRYAYYASQGVVLENDKKLIINDVTYYKNDPISYWDWYLLSPSEKNLFVPETVVSAKSYKTSTADDAEVFESGIVKLPSEYTTWKNSLPSQKNNAGTDNEETVAHALYDVAANKWVPADEIYRSSNNLSHDTGYLLTYRVNNPSKWDTWYTEKEDKDYVANKAHEKTQEVGDDYEHYEDGPTYYLNTSGAGAVLGQRSYDIGDIISQDVEDGYQNILTTSDAASWVAEHVTAEATKDQATFEPAYMVTNPAGISSMNWNYGYAMSASTVADKQQDGSYTVKSQYTGSVAPAYICTSTIQMDKTEFIYLNSTMSETDKTGYIGRVNTEIGKILKEKTPTQIENLTMMSQLTEADLNALTSDQKTSLKALLTLKQDLDKYIQPAYYCVSKGDYGGKWYQTGVNYRGLEAWSSMSKTDRDNFTFNYDALDLLIDPTYSRAEKVKYQYDDPLESVSSYTDDSNVKNPAGYSITQPVDYTATYNGSSTDIEEVVDNPEDPENPLHKYYMTTPADEKIYRGTELDREAFEALPNEQRHYSGIVVKDGKKVTEGETTTYHVYVVKNDFQIGNTPYSVGSIIPPNSYTSDMSSNVTELIFAEGDKEKTYYYCREKYEMGATVSDFPRSDTPVAGTSIKGAAGGTETDGGKTYVKVGTVIASGNGSGQYGSLPNDQKNFTIHGISPTETSTLYVSRESDIYDLSTEKIITVVYKYDYEESDTYGNTTPVTERHVVNIHINFKSGVPEVEDIKAPQLVLAGSKVGLREPNVTPGAYEVTGGGWELFRSKPDAESHTNGTEFNQATDSLFWYQNDYYVAYYAKTYLGKTYSNAVQVSVANYHDLKKVVEANKHHYYIDHKDVKREPKIYINDYSKDETGSKNGLDLLKSLFDLSVLNVTDDDKDENGLIEDGVFKGHKPLDNRVRGGDNLEFFLRTNIDHTPVTSPNPAYDPENPGDTPETITTGSWSSIGSGDDPCFSGVLHGDGYYISGLDHSLFDKLCGQVYNLGVMGSFTGAGVAERGSGYVENCWVKTSATSGFDGTTKAVFGNPSRDSNIWGDNLTQLVNCYYPQAPLVPESSAPGASMIPLAPYYAEGPATQMPDKAFYNGEVAYDLNGFYLKKRYYDNNTKWTDTKIAYNYLKANADGTLPETMSSGNYPDSYVCYPLKSNAPTYGYVENRFADGDYVYAGGFIPDNVDMRVRTRTETIGGKETDVTYYVPIWPDDYIYFGQALNYGHVDTRTHQDVPSHIAKSSDRIDTDVTGNRVYRAPAYFRSSEMRVAYYNPFAVFAKTKKGNTAVKAYENMTAIDFTGHNDVDAGYDYLREWQKWSMTSQQAQSVGQSTDKYAFYPPLLDDGGVKGFVNADLTQNLLAYTQFTAGEGHENDACNVTDATVRLVLEETPYAEGDATGTGYVAGKKTYRTVALSDPQYVKGHWVQKSGDTYKALTDHQLVDKQDFNAPIGYTFDMIDEDKGYRMWYQRTPDNFAGQKHDMDENGNPILRSDAGWESISLPFAAELVTTNDKGEITHFYSGSTVAPDDGKMGHEYWLREFTDIKVETKENVTTATADFKYPTAVSTDATKTVHNTFLWDYYYKAAAGHNQLDKNKDTYQTYYNGSRDYVNYRQLQGGTPYIIGFPGVRYYEFDLSGGFEAYPTTATYKDYLPAKLSKQTITFASNPGAEIAVSDGEMKGVKKTNNNNSTDYYFYPNYLNIEMPAGGYVMSYDGDAYNMVTSEDVTAKKNKVSAFRTYFSTSATPQTRAARRIVFGGSTSQLGGDDQELQDNVAQSMEFYAKKHKIVVTSHMLATADVAIFNVSGMCIASFSIEPGETIETPVNNSGVYIVRAAGGHYTKKVTVK